MSQAQRARAQNLDPEARRAAACPLQPGQTADPKASMLALQRTAGNQAVLRLLQAGAGRPLDGATRSNMESRFGHDFSDVQIHADQAAAASAETLGAKAYTLGTGIVFGAGRFAPETAEGGRLLAHELAHVVQQSQAADRPHGTPEQSEAEARHASTTVLAGNAPTIATTAPPGVQCDPLDDPVKNPRGVKVTRVPPAPDPPPEPMHVNEPVEHLPPGTHKITNTPNPRTSTISRTKLIRDALKKEGVEVPPNHDVHHIVEENAHGPLADRARALLEEGGIGIHDGANLVPLPNKRGGGLSRTPTDSAVSHEEMHTQKYLETLVERLEKTPPNQRRAALRDIRRKILENDFPHHPKAPTPKPKAPAKAPKTPKAPKKSAAKGPKKVPAKTPKKAPAKALKKVPAKAPAKKGTAAETPEHPNEPTTKAPTKRAPKTSKATAKKGTAAETPEHPSEPAPKTPTKRASKAPKAPTKKGTVPEHPSEPAPKTPKKTGPRRAPSTKKPPNEPPTKTKTPAGKKPAEPAVHEPAPKTAEPAVHEPAPKTAEPVVHEPAPKTAEPVVHEPAPKTPVEPVEPVVPGAKSSNFGAGMKEIGTTGGLLALQIAAGYIHQGAVQERIEKEADKTGYVPHGAPSGEGKLYDIGAWLLDPLNDADKSVSDEKRFKIGPWREHLRSLAAGKQVGDSIEFTWQNPVCKRNALQDFEWEYEDQKVIYRKGADGRWTVESGDASGTPDFNDIISPDVPDSKVAPPVVSGCGGDGGLA